MAIQGKYTYKGIDIADSYIKVNSVNYETHDNSIEQEKTAAVFVVSRAPFLTFYVLGSRICPSKLTPIAGKELRLRAHGNRETRTSPQWPVCRFRWKSAHLPEEMRTPPQALSGRPYSKVCEHTTHERCSGA